MQSTLSAVALALVPVALKAQAAPAEERALATLVPEHCIVYVDASGALPLFEQGLDHPFVRALRTSPLGEAFLPQLPLSPEAALARADAWLGQPVLLRAAELANRGLGFGFDPTTKKSVLLARGSDPATVERGLALVFDAIERQFGSPGAFDHPHKRWSDADVWVLDDACVARRGALLVLGNDQELVGEVLELAADPEGRGLLARPRFAESSARRAYDAAAWVWIDMEGLAPTADDGFRKLRDANRAPAAHGLLGSVMASLVSAPVLSAALTLAPERVELELRATGAAGAAELLPLARAGAVPADPGGDAVASALLYRDYGRWFTHRAELFPPEVLPGFAEALTNGALFFEGRDLGEDVLAGLSPWIRLVARELDYDDGRQPEIPLPGVAAVAVLADERAGETWSAAFQTLVAIANVDQAQKGGKSLRLRLEREGDVQISAARYPAPEPGDGVDVRYNLEPALAIVGRHLVLGSHASLVRDLVRELAGVPPGEAARAHESLAIDARGLRAVLAQNFELLVARKMLSDGLARDAAESEIGVLRLALDSLAGARVELANDDPAAPELRVELRLSPQR